MKPFVLLATRAEDLPADEEYALFLRYSGLTEDQLIRVRLEAGPMPALDLDDLSGIFVGGGPFNASDADDRKSPVQHRVEAEFAALRYFALNGTDHRSHTEQNAAIAGYVRWHNIRAQPKVNFATDSPIRTWSDYPAKAA